MHMYKKDGDPADDSSHDSDGDDDSDVTVNYSADSDTSDDFPVIATGSAIPSSSSHNENEEEEKEKEEEDEVVKAIGKEKQKSREHPPDIHVEDYIVDISFHPQEDIIATATITGDVIFHKYTLESTEIVNTLELHTKACRNIEFSSDGKILFSSSKDRSILLSDVSTGELKQCYGKAHSGPISSLLVVDEFLLASGDDNGRVKLWDIRKSDPIFSLKEMDEYVSSMITTEARKYLVCTSGEGTITSIDLSTRRMLIQSEMYEAELTCMGTVRNESKLVVGSSKGTLYIFNWGEFGHHNDEFPGVKYGINCLVPVTENIVVTGGEDGILRATHLFPQHHLGVVGRHHFSVESLDISNDGQFIASCTHDETINFWNIKYFEDVKVDCKKKSSKKELDHNLPSSNCSNASDFFSELGSS